MTAEVQYQITSVTMTQNQGEQPSCSITMVSMDGTNSTRIIVLDSIYSPSLLAIIRAGDTLTVQVP